MIPGLTRIVRACLLAAAALFTFAAPAPSQVAELQRLRSRFSPQAYEQVSAIVQGAQRTGVPTDPLVLKALEGVAKGVPEDRILSVVSRLRETLQRVQSLLEEAGLRDAPPSVVAGVASGLERGAPPDALGEIVRAQSGGDPTIAVHVLADLMARGVPVQRAREILVVVLQRGGQAPDVMAIPPALDRLRDRGLPASDAARTLLSALRSGQAPSTIAVPPGAPARRGVPGARPEGPPGRPGTRPQGPPTPGRPPGS